MAESFLVDVLRPLDMLHLRFEFRGRGARALLGDQPSEAVEVQQRVELG